MLINKWSPKNLCNPKKIIKYLIWIIHNSLRCHPLYQSMYKFFVLVPNSVLITFSSSRLGGKWRSIRQSCGHRCCTQLLPSSDQALLLRGKMSYLFPFIAYGIKITIIIISYNLDTTAFHVYEAVRQFRIPILLYQSFYDVHVAANCLNLPFN